MSLPMLRLVNLVASGVLAGNELGSRFVVHPALDSRPASTQIPAEQALYRRYGRVMPVLMNLAVFTPLPVLARIPNRKSPAFRLTLAGFGCLLGMLAITLRGNLPLNRQILDFDPNGAPERFAAVRARWDRLHAVRVVLDVSGFVLFCLGALSRAGE